MRVAVDMNGCYTTQAGTARYVRGLLTGLKSMDVPDLQVYDFAWRVPNFEYAQPLRAIKTLYREFIWSGLIAPAWLKHIDVDLLHVTSQITISRPAGCRLVHTLLDLVALQYPEKCRPWMRRAARRFYRNTGKADRLICISHFVADQAMGILQVPSDRIDVVHLASGFDLDAAPALEKRPDVELPQEFFLFVGSLEPSKNLSLLRDVYAMAAARGQSLPPLCIVGARWLGVPDEGMPPRSWIYMGRRPDSELIYLYRRAIALVFPSKYEGFGLPIVEAMSLGCPVICSPVTSIPEVAGRAALFCDQTPEDYLRAMLLLQNGSARAPLISAGIEQARKFGWEKCARETVDVYRKALAS